MTTSIDKRDFQTRTRGRFRYIEMATARSGGGTRRTENVGGVSRLQRRELQVARAEEMACRRAAETLRLDMADERARLESAVGEYGRRKTALVRRQKETHQRLSLVLQNRSAAELAREAVRDRLENELKARRTAGTVRAYQLDARWRQLHGRYRGFVSDVLNAGGPSAAPAIAGSPRDPSPQPRARTGAAAAGRRFFAAADKVSTRYRRESLRTTRSLHALMVGYLRETAASACVAPDTVTGKSAADVARSSTHRRSLAVLDGIGPERVLDELRVMQEQCARIAERVRRRSAAGGAPNADARDADDKRGRHDLLSDARDRLAAGRDYVKTLRDLTDRAVAELQRDQLELRKLLFRTCASCTGQRVAVPSRDRSDTVVEIAGRLERACFALFSRLDRAGADGRRPEATSSHDVVTLCLRAVQTRRTNDARQARDVAHRVNDFRKAVGRLLLAVSVTNGIGLAATGNAGEVAPKRQDAADRVPDRTRSRTKRPDNARTPIVPPLPRDVSTDAATVTMLCPPSIDIVGYKT